MTFLSPGVYVQEVPSQVSAITGVSTSIAAFIGVVGSSVPLVAKNPTFDPLADAATANGKKFTFVTHPIPTAANKPVLLTSWAQFTRAFGDLIGNAGVDPVATGTPVVDVGYQALSNAVYGFFNNGGGQCYVVRIATPADLQVALTALAAIPEIAIVAAPGQTGTATYTALIAHCTNVGNRVAILDSLVTDSLTNLTSTDEPGKSDFAAFYYPWVTVSDPGTLLMGSTDGSLAVPPSGHIAGIYARVDTERGVFKSPANEVVRGAIGVSVGLSRADQDQLNPKGVNAIRVFKGNATVFGARTVGGDANGDLKYISVRRTLLFLRESIEQGMQFAVFEPNTPALWAKISRNINAFLTTVWRSGALFGTTPQQAFTVKCDADNNQDPSIGQVTVDIGVAIARPAEFVVFRISQSTPTTTK